jgi:hypothetical protein
LKRELMHWNEVILVAFGSLNENRPQEFLLLVLLHVYNDSHQYPKLPDYFLKMPRYIKFGEVWSVMFRINTGLANGQHRMLTWLSLACSFEGDIFEVDATLMGWINDPPIGTQLRINVPALKSWKRTDGNVSFITNELIKLVSAKQYLAAVANVRTLYQISRELHTNIDYKEKTKNTLKLIIITSCASRKWWDRKLEEIKNYSVLKLGNELSRGTNNELIKAGFFFVFFSYCKTEKLSPP